MDTPGAGPSFPRTAPVIAIAQSEQQLDPIDCPELQWWLAIPRLGDRTAYAGYDIDTGELDWARQVVWTAPATVGGEEAVELLVREWSRDREGDRVRTDRFTCVLDQDRARWLAVTLDTGGEARTATAADPGFESDWGATGPRRLVDSGRYQPLADGSYRLTDAPDPGAGVYRVRIGVRVFTCLRVIDLRAADEWEEAGVAFVERGGRTVLYRQYRGRAINADWRAWRAAHPGREMVINGSLFLQRSCTGRAHDVLTATSFGSLANQYHQPQATSLSSPLPGKPVRTRTGGLRDAVM